MPEKQTYIKEVKLSGYKSIKNVSCEFEEGLNVIIGNNGTGKTNLLEFIDKTINRDFAGLNVFDADIKIFKGSNFSESKSLINDKSDFFHWQSEGRLSENTVNAQLNNINVSAPPVDIFFYTEFVRFNLPEIPILSKELIGNYLLDNRSIIWKENGSKLPFSLSVWLRRTFFEEEYSIEHLQTDSADDYLHDILSSSFNKAFDDVRLFLNRYTPIEDVRFSKSMRVANIDSSTLEFRNIILEYKINDDWFPWDALSDGSKRLVYLIFAINRLQFKGGEKFDLYPVSLIEEPELGIHPHQLHLLLNFLKEKSKDQQIIITTHSPQVLDILEPDELNKIIIAEIDFKNGTVLRHLNTEEIEKANAYFKDQGLLSDYWRFSDLQRSKKVK